MVVMTCMKPSSRALNSLRRSFTKSPTSLVQLGVPDVQRFLVASDAALDTPRAGTGGFLAVWLQGAQEQRHAWKVDIPSEMYDIWVPSDYLIAQLELLMILAGLILNPGHFRGRRGLWWVDNVAALIALVRGKSNQPDLD